MTEISGTVIHDMESAAKTKFAEDGALTIDQLADRVGMTVRNLREWRTLGLLPPAEMRGRTGYYAPAVVERIRRIQSLRAEGFTLELIARMLDTGRAADEVMRLAEVLRAPFHDAGGPVVDPEGGAGWWGSGDPADLGRAVELGVLRERGDGWLEFTSARIAEIGAELSALGLSPAEILDATAAIRSHVDAIAEVFEGVWRAKVWRPFLEAGMPQRDLGRLQDTAARVQPLALDAVIAIFTVAMEARIAQGIASELES